MVHLEDGKKYVIVNAANHQLASYGRGDELPGGWLVTEPRSDRYESEFVAKAVPGDKWKFMLVDKSGMCLGFRGIKPVCVVKDDGGAHTEWQVDPSSGPNHYEIHMSTDSGHVCWTVPAGAPQGAVVSEATCESERGLKRHGDIGWAARTGWLVWTAVDLWNPG
ncbi:hypothetical protein AG1IA_08356 [Rhizoctonia solani AG-1 IA]|uniref:Ricin B lectin domain-containing protein n=1 Tax=Thanatephorus cucumeris (strain AG1-IA) TaxID=983506 RepID=L8WMN7_THACA|nr:hypothetical protein AG1IA_09930 [Rhizoctonia solani AG-1 IA]ELU37614.1 hypothetical protein AG1IA_08356 [Rhizoctonia solani AG-1 IA]